MRVLVLVLVLVAACDDTEQKDTPAVAAAKAECMRLEAHIFEISPQSKGADARALVAALPTEDIEQCAAGEPEIRACMFTATDIAAVKACIPPAEVIACMQKAVKHPDVRRACASDPKAADKLPAE